MKTAFFSALAGCLLLADNAFALYAAPQLAKTPIDRLAANIQAQLKEKPQDAAARFNLARLHAMAYASKTDVVQTSASRPNQPWFGYEPQHVPFKAVKTDDPAKLKAAKKQLALALEQYQKVVAMKPDHLSAQLGYGWCLEQAGKKAEAVAQYRKTIELGWAQEKEMRFAGPGWRSIVQEAAGYLKPHLDPAKDQKELARLRVQIKKINSIARAVTPIAIPLRDGMRLEDFHARQAQVAFDADGSGHLKTWSWIRQDAGWLVYDADGSGKVTSALQMFGNVTFWLFWDNGYQAMQSLDDNRDGMLAGQELQKLAIWRDANSNGVSDPGEVRPLAEWGIVKLSCRHQLGSDQQRTPYSDQGVYFEDGSVRATYDLILQPQSAQAFKPAVGK